VLLGQTQLLEPGADTRLPGHGLHSVAASWENVSLGQSMHVAAMLCSCPSSLCVPAYLPAGQSAQGVRADVPRIATLMLSKYVVEFDRLRSANVVDRPGSPLNAYDTVCHWFDSNGHKRVSQ
jgi:hypothetical protein